jgi:replicative DNA helicase
VDQVTDADFYLPAHRSIFSAFLQLYARNAPVDQVTVFDYLRDHDQLELAGGAVYLAELSKAVVSGANAGHYAKIVRDKSMQRSLIDVSAGIIANSYDSSRDVQELVGESEKAILSISERVNSKTFTSSGELIKTIYETLNERLNNKNMSTGVSTGYARLDAMTNGGLQPSDLIILAARPGVGKTAFALNIAIRAALGSGVTVAVFSLEMNKESLMDRMLCAWGRVDHSHVRSGHLNDEEWTSLSHAADALTRARIFIDDTAVLTPLALSARCRRLKAEQGALDLVIVDYLQLMRSPRNDSRELEVSDISRNLKALAKELKVPVLALAQLNRQLASRTDKTPQLSDLRESGAIEQDADLIMFIHQDDAYNNKDEKPPTSLTKIMIRKHRNGPTGNIELAYQRRFTAFDELETTYVQPSEQQ